MSDAPDSTPPSTTRGPRRVEVPDLSLVVLVGVTGSGKSSFAARHFLPTEVVSSDRCRALVSDDENDQTVTPAAFELLHAIVAKRLQAGRLTVVDATNLRREDRRPLVELARRHHVLPVAVVIDTPREVCAARNAERPDRAFGPHVLRNQHGAFRRSVGGLGKEGFRRVVTLRGVDQVEHAVVVRERRWSDHRDATGPFDVIGDIHGCADELVDLLTTLGWAVEPDRLGARHPDDRTAVFLGDLVDRGPATPAVLRLVMGMVAAGTARCIPGNHENKLARALRGRNVKQDHGLAESLAQITTEPDGFGDEVAGFIEGLVSHLVLDGGDLVVAHAGLPEEMHNRQSGAVRSFALYGDTTGETDEYGLPVRYPWADDYRGRASVVYGHTPVVEPLWVNGTICIDTGCVFGGSLTALRWPERELVSVRAREMWWEPSRPSAPAAAAAAAGGREPGVLDLTDVAGKRIIETRLGGRVTIGEDQSYPALEVMSRFAVDPRWLVHLPPTMAPTATSAAPGLLEHPAEAFESFARDGVDEVVCQEKHMGSRAIVVLGRDPAAIERRFGFGAGEAGVGGGIVITRTGRRFFDDRSFDDRSFDDRSFDDGPTETELLARVRRACDRIDLWDELRTDWVVLDAELLPWSAKAGELLRRQYAPVGTAATATVRLERDLVRAAAARGVDVGALGDRAEQRVAMVDGYGAAWRQYCWDVASVDDLRLAPFSVLASEGDVGALRPHAWHLGITDRLAAAAPGLVRATATRHVALDDEAAVSAAIAWWEELTAAGGEGIVVKPATTVARSSRGLVQPGIKCRGRGYLRIIYGPEYTEPANLARLRQRGLGHKRSLALREFALGIEALERFVGGEPLHRVHECVFGVLALETEPVDPRL